MKADLIKVSTPSVDMQRIYHEAFPPEERRQWNSIAALAADPGSGFALYKVMTDSDVAGMVSVWMLGGVRYVEHLAIDVHLRGAGIGGAVVDKLRALSAEPLLLEVEPPELSDMAARRIAFYRRHGFELLDYDYIQPPYAPGLPEVVLRLMATAPLPDLDMLIKSELYPRVYGKI